MNKTLLFTTLLATTTLGATDTTLLRSEFEKVGSTVGIIEGVENIVTGENSHFYSVDKSTGKIKIAQEITDTMGVVTTHTVKFTKSSGDTVTVDIVDGYDYLLSKHSGEIIEEHQGGVELPDTLGSWAAYNNLWGDGNAVVGQDYRIAILISDSLPNGSSIVWDTPSSAKDFEGSSVWCYTNFMFGARKNNREVVEGFPFSIDSLDSLYLDFDYSEVVGDDQFKVALNMFLTDTNSIAPMNQNRGDFFFVLDQKGTWIPRYDTTIVEDTTILTKPFTLLYDTLIQNGGLYERRRVIIKDNQRLLSGNIDLLYYFNRFAEGGMLKKSQYIPNIQFGVEVTSGFGAIKINTLSITKKMIGSVAISNSLLSERELKITQSGHTLNIKTAQEFKRVSLYSPTGKLILTRDILEGDKEVKLNTQNIAKGDYILKLNGAVSLSKIIIIK